MGLWWWSDNPYFYLTYVKINIFLNTKSTKKVLLLLMTIVYKNDINLVVYFATTVISEIFFHVSMYYRYILNVSHWYIMLQKMIHFKHSSHINHHCLFKLPIIAKNEGNCSLVHLLISPWALAECVCGREMIGKGLKTEVALTNIRLDWHRHDSCQ